MAPWATQMRGGGLEHSPLADCLGPVPGMGIHGLPGLGKRELTASPRGASLAGLPWEAAAFHRMTRAQRSKSQLEGGQWARSPW